MVEGPKLGAQLTDTINKGLVSQEDPKKVTQLHDRFARPVNIPNLRVPKLNKEVIVTEHNLTRKPVDVYSTKCYHRYMHYCRHSERSE